MSKPIVEAIDHAKRVADSYSDTVPDCSCAVEHRQLVGWLRELLDLRDSHKALLIRAETAERQRGIAELHEDAVPAVRETYRMREERDVAVTKLKRVEALLPVMQEHFDNVRPWCKNTAIQIRIDMDRIRTALDEPKETL